ncbi:MAG: hypothetical protein LQ343_000959 [Gyalolechia ehrenbergii]|nr:MAG: hypothetical protein LQ343_000959 [Gyalolechia ehrenbergii]
MATYDSGADDWFASTVAGGAFGFSDRLNLLYASVPQFGKSFALGGNSGIIQGFLYFDSSVPDSLTWTNVTQDATGNDVPSNIGGAMIHVPMGRSGILLVIGGAESSRADTEDVYVLTIPSFRYLKMSTDNVEAVNESTGHDASTCATWNDAEMIVLGGRGRQDTVIVGGGDCDPSFPPTRVLDVNRATLKTALGGWEEPNLENIFSQTMPPLVKATTSTAQLSTTNQAALSTTSSSSSGLSGGTIAGIVISPLFAVAVLAAAIAFIPFKRRRSGQVLHVEMTPDPVEP